ncbi:MAG: hypothetical protein M3Q31_25370 [Actinomycetota bacterium]|nr:hypothetical protein [Actinomycetota bacterium]
MGTTDPVIVRATKVDQTKSSTVELRVIDVAGNVTVCDPVVTLVISQAGKPVAQTVRGVPRVEHKIAVTKGDPGISKLKITVNARSWRLRGLIARPSVSSTSPRRCTMATTRSR